MAGLIPQSFIDDLINRLDIVDVVSSRANIYASIWVENPDAE